MPSSSRYLRRSILKLPAVLWAVSAAGAAFDALSQTARNVVWVVPVPSGGGMDATARLIAEQVRDSLGLVIVDNKPGAALRLGLYAVRGAAADSVPDPYRLLARPSLWRENRVGATNGKAGADFH